LRKNAGKLDTAENQDVVSENLPASGNAANDQ